MLCLKFSKDKSICFQNNLRCYISGTIFMGICSMTECSSFQNLTLSIVLILQDAAMNFIVDFQITSLKY